MEEHFSILLLNYEHNKQGGPDLNINNSPFLVQFEKESVFVYEIIELLCSKTQNPTQQLKNYLKLT